jgi:molybdopterin molybdotransferase
MAAPIPIEQAFAKILNNAGLAPVVRVPLTESLGHYLAEDVKADRDIPPFNRATVDGYAVFSSDTRSAPDVLEVIEDVPAGATPTRVVSPGQAIRIMTGAPVPAGADAVIMQERTDIPKPGFVRFQMTMKSGQNVAPRGQDAKLGGVLIAAGAPIGPAEIGMLAVAGCSSVPVRRQPRVAILGTGDELVEPDKTPGPSQIRNSNSYQLLAQCAARHLPSSYLGIAPDRADETRKLVNEGLQADVFISTGGVSVGERDFVGATFKESGVEILFDKVAIKPGKPTTFGKYRRGNGEETLVFGLPGNPVAAFVCFHLFVMTAIRKRANAADPLPRWFTLPLLDGVKGSGDRTTFRPAKLLVKDSATFVVPLEWHGSGHLGSLTGADGLFVQKPDEELNAGDCVTYYPFET